MFLLKQIYKLTFIVYVASLIGCGVKGPPEAPYPTEATTKKDISGNPAPVPFAMPKANEDTSKVVAPAKAAQKKKNSQ